MRVAVFTRSTALSEIEDDISEWLEEERLSPADVLVKQSQSSTEEGTILTISVWYIPRPAERDIPTFEEVMNSCPHCGDVLQPAEEETLPRSWEENCPQWKQRGAFCGYHRDWHGPDGECPTSKDEAKKFNAIKTSGFGSEIPF